MATTTHTAVQSSGDSTSGTAQTLRVLVADNLTASGMNGLERLSNQVRVAPELTDDSMAAAVSAFDPDIVVVRSTKVPAAAIESGDRLSLIIRAGAGYDNIDVAAASRRGIFVSNCPGKNAIAVAELTWGLICCCDRRIPDQTVDLRQGRWDKKGYGKSHGLYGRTMGIVGLGRIGQEIAHRGRAFGMNVLAWSRSLTQERADELGIGYCSSLINLAKMSDVVSINVAATPETKGLIGQQFFQAMKPGAIFINTSRGSVVDSPSLIEAIRDRELRAGLDVYGQHPSVSTGEFSDPVINEPGVYGTHHCGASTNQAQEAIAMEVVAIVDAYQRTGTVLHCVNQAASTSATTLLTVRHLNRPGVLAHVFYTLGQAGINVAEMQNLIYDGHEAACARIQLDSAPDEQLLAAMAANESVLSIDLMNLSEPG